MITPALLRQLDDLVLELCTAIQRVATLTYRIKHGEKLKNNIHDEIHNALLSADLTYLINHIQKTLRNTNRKELG